MRWSYSRRGNTVSYTAEHIDPRLTVCLLPSLLYHRSCFCTGNLGKTWSPWAGRGRPRNRDAKTM